MSKRPTIDLMTLTSQEASPMPEALQRTPVKARTPTANLQPLAFKVPPEFRRRFRQRAADADMKLNELLFEALDAWEEKKGVEKKNS